MSPLGGRERLHVEEEYGAQLHKLSPYKLYNSVVKIIKSVIDEGMEGWEQSGPIQIPQCDNTAVASALKSEFYASIDRNGPELMNAIKKSLSIPQDFLLPEDEIQRQQYADQELEDIQKRTADLKRRYEYNEQLISLLEAESEILESVEEVEKKKVEWQETCKKCWDETRGMRDQVEILMSNKENSISEISWRSIFSKMDNSKF